MRAIGLCFVLAACGSKSESPPAGGSAPAPKTVAAAPAPAGSGSAAAAPAPAPAPAPARALDPKRIITATSFGPYKAGEKVTKKQLEAKFGMTFESEAEMENPEDGSTTSAKWRAEANETVGGGGLALTKDGSEWQVWLPTFYDARGLGVGATGAQLVAGIPDLKCEHIADEEPVFECWSAAAPNLRYGGGADHELAQGFTKQTVAAKALTVSYLKWQPPTQ